METLENRIKRIEYYQELLFQMMENNKFPVYDLIIKNKLTKEEVEELFQLCRDLSEKYESQKEEGFLHFESLLTQFVGLVNVKLSPKDTINAFYLQGMYSPLMEMFIKVLKEDDQKVHGKYF